MKILNKIIAIFVALPLLTGCFDDPGTDVTFEGSFVEIDNATTSEGETVSNFYEQQADGVATMETVTITLASATLNQSVTVNYEVSGSAVEGVHYNMLSSGGSVTIPAGEHSATIEYEVLTYNFSLEDSETLTFTITDASVELSQYTTFTNQIAIKCSSNIPEGTYLETGTGGMEVELVALGDGRYTLSQMNFRYYNPAYADIPGTFNDVCNNLTLEGVPVPEAYGIAWVGSGSFDPGTNTLTFTVADATYNPDYTVDMTFVYQP